MRSDPYKYFRVEARELVEGLTQGALELEKGTADREMVGSLLRLAHTLKGASRVVKLPALGDLAHGVEDVLSPFRDAQAPAPRTLGRQVLDLLDQIVAGLGALDAPGGTRLQPRTAASEEPLETVRVDVEEVEGVLNGLAEVSVLLERMQTEVEGLHHLRRLAGQMIQQVEPEKGSKAAHARRMQPLAEEFSNSMERLARSLGPGTEEVQRELAFVRERATRLRLLPARAIFPSVVRAVRDAANTLGKQAALETSGGDIRMDAQVLLAVRDAVIQLARNAVAHGVEGPEARRAAGKPAAGRIALAVERRGNRVAFTCRDDGKGIDLEAIRKAAVDKGVVSPGRAAGLGLRETIDLILRGGVTTTATPTEISGRGIGLDVVRELAARLKGQISVETADGKGTAVEISVPVSLTSIPALHVESDGVRTAIPLDSVREARRIAASEIVRGPGGECVAYEGWSIPFLPLARVLQGTVRERRQSWCAVIVADGAARVAVGVDRMAGSGTVVVRPLPALAAPARALAGATLDAEGNPELVLDPAGLIEAAGLKHVPTASAANPRPAVLVIDDSLTTRMVEQTILESAGYEVEVAQSGEEGLEKALKRPYGAFLVDVEMPGMDGFDFISRTREIPSLREIPAVLVTSRNSPEDRERGDRAGARAFIVKSEFDQGQFLHAIGQLVRC